MQAAIGGGRREEGGREEGEGRKEIPKSHQTTDALLSKVFGIIPGFRFSKCGGS